MYNNQIEKNILYEDRDVLVCRKPSGMPLLGDRKYNPSGERGVSLGLCSCGLEFKHPKTGKQMKFETEPQGSAFLDFVKKL